MFRRKSRSTPAALPGPPPGIVARIEPIGEPLSREPADDRPRPRRLGPVPVAPDERAAPMSADDRFLAGLRSLKPEAYEELLDRFEAPLYRFFYYSHGNHDLAEDQCGDVFAQVILAVHKMRGDAGALRSFIFGIARNVMRRGWRARPARAFGEGELERMPDRQPSVFRQVADRQEWEQAIGAIEQLADPARQVVILRFIEGLSLEEISQSLEMPQGSVKSAIHRARKQLRHLRDETA